MKIVVFVVPSNEQENDHWQRTLLPDNGFFFFQQFVFEELQIFGVSKFRCEQSRSVWFSLNFSVRGCCRDHSVYFF